MRIDIKPQGGDRYKRALAGLTGAQFAQATAEAINMALGRAKNAMRAEMESVFDRPTGYILRSIRVVKKATAGDPNALIAPTYMREKDVDPQQILRAQEKGGRRRDKRIEVALRRAGFLPSGMQIAIPADKYGGPLEGSADKHGNLRGPFLRKLLTYLNTSWGDVERAKRGRAGPMLKRYEWGSNAKTRRVFKLMDGKEFFVSNGRSRSGLGAGIWAREGKTLKLVVAFVKEVNYSKPRLSLDAVRKRSGVDELIPRWIRGRVYEAFKKANLG